MRQSHKKQLPLSLGWPEHDLSQELRVISDILDRYSIISEMALQDISEGRRTDRGASGMSGDQVVRCTILKRMHGLSYSRLSFHISDSMSFREFVRLGFGEHISKSTLQENIKKLKPETWEEIHKVIIGHARKHNIERGRKVRGDTTVVETHIHHPHDSGLLWDCVRVVTRLMVKMSKLIPGKSLPFKDHRRRARKRYYTIINTHKDKERKKAYYDLIDISEKTYGYGVDTLQFVGNISWEKKELENMFHELTWYVELMDRVIYQTRRRVIYGEKVSVEEKVVSIFEPHTDIIVKKPRETVFGHKVALMGGESSMILDCIIEQGNPSDESLAQKLVERQKALWDRVPRQVVFDGGFASKSNLQSLKNMGVKDVAFSKKRGMKISEMVKSSWVFKRLRRFRAGIEGCISTLKRVFRLDRCTWRGMESFESYVLSGIVAYNLIVVARHLLQ